MSSPSIPKGTRDFTPVEMTRRNYIFDAIRSIFKLHGYLPIETPAMENLSTLMGKYGEEGDKLLFKILNSGNYLSDVPEDIYTGKETGKILKHISEKGLRYDLTVPFARFVVQHNNEITFPFKRFQIQPVWRADRPQKGRYREFYQCDVDVIGSNSLLYEVEMVTIASEIFKKLGISITILMNNRKILSGIAEVIGESARITDITVAIDKLDKIGQEGVNKELAEKGLSDETIAKLQPILGLKGNSLEKLDQLSVILASSEAGMKGIEEMRTIFNFINVLQPGANVEIDLTLARGLNYYTGAIIEIKANDVQMGSISGGGRYDDLTGIFGLKGMSGIGISFGADRIYDVLNELKLFPQDLEQATTVLLVNFGGNEELVSLKLLQKLHDAGISAEIYPEPLKMKKQFGYADNKKIPYTIIIGADEAASGSYQLKNMLTGEQEKISGGEIIEKLK
ncbi:MAG: histidine--tRNA ligase [Bacteroidales bacterium]|nr:histidine--tRNA ligase [Bacteroidales bacterium]